MGIALATRILQAMKEEKKPLPAYKNRYRDRKDAGLISHLILGTCRFYPYLNDRLDALLDRPLGKNKQLIRHLCLIAIYQISWTTQPNAHVVDQAVRACRSLKFDWATKLVNFVLRSHIRVPISELHHAHPPWLLTSIQKAWPKHQAQIIAANNTQSPIHLRPHNIDVLSLSTKLKHAGIAHALSSSNTNSPSDRHKSPLSILLSEDAHVTDCPGFEEGWFYIQDHGAQWAAHLLDVPKGASLLDACCGVGGKTTHLASLYDPSLFYAIDSNPKHLTRLEENLKRLKIKKDIHIVKTDIEHMREISFDRILFDAPCSATGTIGRHPEIKVIREANDHPRQLPLLTHLWKHLLPKGRLLYTTCSILPEENEQVIEAFLANHDAKEIPLSIGIQRSKGIQILPSEWSNGFYYCLLEKP